MSNTTITIQPSGIIDAGNGGKLRQAIVEAFDAGALNILIDCQQVNFIDSSGLGALVAAFKVIHGAGGRLFFCSINEQIRMLFELTSLDQVFEIVPDSQSFAQTVTDASPLNHGLSNVIEKPLQTTEVA